MGKKKPIVTPFGQWAYPGEITVIPSNTITMKGVDYPVMGIDNLGNSELMLPGGEYTFPGDYVTEIPQMGKGGLTQWFAEEWTDVKTGKPCGRSGKEKGSRPYPACRPKKRVNETTPKTTSEMSSAEKARFKREKTSGKRIDYNHKRREFGGQIGWLDIYQDGGETSTEQNPVRIASVNVKAEDNIFKDLHRGYNKFRTNLYKYMAKNPAFMTSYLGTQAVLNKTGDILTKSVGTVLPKRFIFNKVRPVDYPESNPLLFAADAALRYIGKGAQPLRDSSGNYVPGEEIYRKILGFDDSSYNYIENSPYKPSKVKDEEKSEYIKFKNLYDPQKLINAYVKAQKTLPEGKTSTVIPSLNPYIINRKNIEASGLPFSQQDPLQNFTLDKGKDEKGTYISLYDKYDFSGPANNLLYGFRKPLEIYDRFYYEKNEQGSPIYKKKKYGGWLDSYQIGGENLPELNSKIDVANFYRNPLSEKYGISKNPDSGAFEYYLKSKDAPVQIEKAKEVAIEIPKEPTKQELLDLQIKDLESQNLRKSYIPSQSINLSSVILPEVAQKQSRLSNSIMSDIDKNFIDSEIYNQNNIPVLDPTQLPVPALEVSLPKKIANKKTSSTITLNPVQQYYADKMYKKYGKVIITDKGTNRTFYGRKKADGTWDINSFEVLTGQNPNFNEISGLSVDELDDFKSKRGTPIGLFNLQQDPDIYGYPGLNLDGTGNIAYHITYKGKDDLYRSRLYNNNNIQDNYRSYGCINCEKPSLENLLKFVSPEDKALIINSTLGYKNNADWIKKNSPELYEELFKENGGQVNWLEKYN